MPIPVTIVQAVESSLYIIIVYLFVRSSINLTVLLHTVQ
jgi:hypothetical protein